MNKTALGLIVVIVLAGLSIVLNASLYGTEPAFAQNAAEPLLAPAPGHHPCTMAQTAKANCDGNCAECDRCKNKACDGKCEDCQSGCPMMGAGLGGAPIRATAENAKTWEKLEGLMVKRHRAMWDYWELAGADKPDEAAVKAKADEIRKMNGEMMLLRKSLGGDQATAGAGCGMAGGMAAGGCGMGRRPQAGGCGGGGCPMGAK